jgi:energy-coupling factor transporter ATP-binding protein EcfA2
LKTLALLRDQGMTVLLVEQIVQDALAVADRGYVIQTGRIAISGKAEKLLQSDWCAKLIWGCREAVFISWKGRRLSGRCPFVFRHSLRDKFFSS